MKKISVFWIVALLFGGVSAYDVIARFGWNAVDLEPNVFWWFSLGVAVRNFVTYTLAFLALPFLFGRSAKWLLALLAAYVIVIEGAVVYTHTAFHAELSSVWLDLARDTSVAEIMNFISMAVTPGVVLILLGIALFLCLGIAGLFRARYPKLTKRNFCMGVALVLPFIICNLIVMNWHWGIAQMNYSQFVVGTYLSYRDMCGVFSACANANLPRNIATKVPRDMLPDVVFVIGESATRNNWNLYGYARSTTPRMNEICQSASGVFYSDVVGTQPATVNALSMLYTDVTFDNLNDGNWTVAEVCRRAGYRCVLISNQLVWGDESSILYRIFNGCDKRICVGHELSGRKCFDESCIPFLNAEFEVADDRPLVAFVHLGGMHYPVRDVNPPEDDYFNDDVEGEVLAGLSDEARDRMNRYDNGIRYEDKVLGLIVDALKNRKMKRPCCMFFCSDHGESPRSKGGRDYDDDDVYEIPVVFWFSDKYAELFPETVSAVKSARKKKMQQDQLTGGLLSLCQIANWEPDMERKNFLSDDFRLRRPRLVAKGKREYSEEDE